MNQDIIAMAKECDLIAGNAEHGIYIMALERFAALVATAAKAQEPVAWMQSDEVHISLWKDDYHTIPLYASPPASKPWVGLTDQEIRDWWRIENGLEDCNMAKLVDFTLAVRAIEAKLREKNT